MRTRTFLTAASTFLFALGLAATSASANGNKLVIEQIDNQNWATGSQWGGSNNETLIRQFRWNSASTPVFGGSNNRVLVLQDDTVASHAGTGDHIAGNNNRWVVIQRDDNRNISFGPIWGNSNNSTLATIQEGREHVVDGGAGAGPFGTGVNFTTNQIDTISLPYTSTNIPAMTDRSVFRGNQNVALLGQLGGDRNRIALHVDGDRNSIVGGAASPAGGQAGSLATIDMNAEASSAFFTGDTILDDTDATMTNGIISGAGFATQEGFDNTAHLVQTGNDNTIRFNQIGNNNTTQVYQTGNQNVATAVQN
jgi:hypothetical protein